MPSLVKLPMTSALPARVVEVGGVGAHAGARGAGFAVSHAGGDANVGEGSVVIVVIELVGLGVVGDKQVKPAVVVIVQQRNPRAPCWSGRKGPRVWSRSQMSRFPCCETASSFGLYRFAACNRTCSCCRASNIDRSRSTSRRSEPRKDPVCRRCRSRTRPRSTENPGSLTPAFAVTSANLPLPRLWKRWLDPTAVM